MMLEELITYNVHYYVIVEELINVREKIGGIK